jgi:hypothetical protein
MWVFKTLQCDPHSLSTLLKTVSGLLFNCMMTIHIGKLLIRKRLTASLFHNHSKQVFQFIILKSGDRLWINSKSHIKIFSILGCLREFRLQHRAYKKDNNSSQFIISSLPNSLIARSRHSLFRKFPSTKMKLMLNTSSIILIMQEDVTCVKTVQSINQIRPWTKQLNSIAFIEGIKSRLRVCCSRPCRNIDLRHPQSALTTHKSTNPHRSPINKRCWDTTFNRILK